MSVKEGAVFLDLAVFREAGGCSGPGCGSRKVRWCQRVNYRGVPNQALPAFHGMRVMPSGLLPSDRSKPCLIIIIIIIYYPRYQGCLRI